MADHVTTRFGFTGLDPDPRALEYVVNWPGTFNALLDAIDGKLTGWSSDVIARRPTAGTAGRVYLATDDRTSSPNGTLYFDNGTAWVLVPTNNYAAGTLASRPRTGTRGQFYYATDDRTVGANGTPYLFDGTGWNQVQTGPVSVATTGTGDGGLARGSFSAYRNAALNINRGSAQVVAFDAEEWDVSGWHDTSTGRFTPQVAGYYRFTAALAVSGLGSGEYSFTALYKNGSLLKTLGQAGTGVDLGFGAYSASALANGTTDYFQAAIGIVSASSSLGLLVGATSAYFQGELVGRS